MTFSILALICTLGQPCTTDTARTVEVIGQETNPLACMRQGLLSSGGSISKPKGGEFLKLVCMRKRG